MPKNQKNLKPKVFFNASVILSGLYSPKGGSAKLLSWVKQKKIIGIISEIIVDEIFRHTAKLKLKKSSTAKFLINNFQIIPAPPEPTVIKYYSTIIDYGDAHVLASAKQTKCQYLVSLDKKHLLSLQKKIKIYSIVSPGKLIETLSNI
ncbi:MAG: putative toxin-antitoxin system toxin component, PIN family [Candidatus Beckwithbacteria bacterium]|nr:putative toxin-antitoxin system toxin component, PIN family [Patescibacteria group bacterium]